MGTEGRAYCPKCGWEGALEELEKRHCPIFVTDEVEPVCPKCGNWAFDLETDQETMQRRKVVK